MMQGRNSWERDNPFCTLRRVVTGAKREGRVYSEECDDFRTAVGRIEGKIGQLSSENASLKKEKELLSQRVEEAEGEKERCRQVQAAKEEVVAQVMAEREKLKAECTRLAAQQPSSGEQNQAIAPGPNVEKFDPFINVMEKYLHNKGNGTSHSSVRGRQLHSEDRGSGDDGQHSVGASRSGTQTSMRQGESPRSDELSQLANNDPETRRLLEWSTSTVQSRRRRIHSDVGNDDVVYSAGVAAQRRRRSLSGYRRSYSSSNVPLRHTTTQRNSLGLDTFMSVLNNNAQNGQLSSLSWLILRILSEARRPVELSLLRRLLSDPTTGFKTECFLRFSLVSHLVARLQAPDCAEVVANVRPCLVESSSRFVHMVNTQGPLSRRRYTASF